MKIITTFIFLFLSIILLGQTDTSYYFGINGKIVTDAAAIHKKTVEFKSKKKATVKTFKRNQSDWEVSKIELYKKTDNDTYLIISGGLKKNTMARNFIELENNTFRFNEVINDKIKRTGYAKSIVPLILHGEVTEFYPNGNKRSISVYNNNELVSNKNWLANGEEYYDNLFYSVDNEPFYLPGNNKLHSHILKTFNENNVDYSTTTGGIVVGFVVFEAGNIGGFRIMKGINGNINQLVLSSLNSLEGEWQPAKLRGQTVRFFQLFPINFIHNETKYENLNLEGGMLNWNVN
ncbi:MAG: hypothetical protein HQ541_07475 [Mariniphaga sp.]|nr:hypothetical protein [Mariniphaga sp.]